MATSADLSPIWRRQYLTSRHWVIVLSYSSGERRASTNCLQRTRFCTRSFTLFHFFLWMLAYSTIVLSTSCLSVSLRVPIPIWRSFCYIVARSTKSPTQFHSLLLTVVAISLISAMFHKLSFVMTFSQKILRMRLGNTFFQVYWNLCWSLDIVFNAPNDCFAFSIRDWGSASVPPSLLLNFVDIWSYQRDKLKSLNQPNSDFLMKILDEMSDFGRLRFLWELLLGCYSKKFQPNVPLIR